MRDVRIYLEGQSEKVAQGEKRWGGEFAPLFHQVRTYEALQRYKLVMNTYNTGTGKTRASLLYLHDVAAKRENALVIAPTNALLGQHAEDISRFVAEQGLDFRVQRLTAEVTRALARAYQSEHGVAHRHGEIVYRLLSNPLAFEPADERWRPTILVVNPDIYYYALFYGYGRHDQRNVFAQFLTTFNYLVIDEFHYYDAKQLTSFLFMVALFDEFGFFDKGRRVCLLSATPTKAVMQYLDEILGGDGWALVSPDNEPPESAQLPRAATLTPAILSLSAEQLGRQWLQGQVDDIVRRLDGGLDGAIISSSLGRINRAHALLRQRVAGDLIGRITGPEPEQARQAATFKRLILATPTVDIGYNFQKQDKARQNIDWLVFDARYQDDVLQRLGRAGRVLPKPIKDQPSEVVGLLPEAALSALSDYDGQRLSRPEFSRALYQLAEALPPRHSLYGYIRHWGLLESFRPIFELGKQLAPRDEHVLEALYERLCRVFAPGSRRSYEQMKWVHRGYRKRETWLSGIRSADDMVPRTEETAYQVRDLLRWEGHNIVPNLDYREGRVQLLRFARSQHAVTEALFSFRDSFQAPTAVVFDPQYLLSSETVNVIDVLHLLSNYVVSAPLSEADFRRISGQGNHPGDFYFRIIKHRDAPLKVRFQLQANDCASAAEFEQRWVHAPVGLQGLKLEVLERGTHGVAVAGGVPPEVLVAIAESPQVAFLIPAHYWGFAYSRLGGSMIWPRDLRVGLGDATTREYKMFMGKNAFLAHAELWMVPRFSKTLRSDFLIIGGEQ